VNEIILPAEGIVAVVKSCWVSTMTATKKTVAMVVRRRDDGSAAHDQRQWRRPPRDIRVRITVGRWRDEKGGVAKGKRSEKGIKRIPKLLVHKKNETIIE